MRRATIAALRRALAAEATASSSSSPSFASRAFAAADVTFGRPLAGWLPPLALDATTPRRLVSTSAAVFAREGDRDRGRWGKGGGGGRDDAPTRGGKKPFKRKSGAAKGTPERFAALMEEDDDDVADAGTSAAAKASPRAPRAPPPGARPKSGAKRPSDVPKAGRDDRTRGGIGPGQRPHPNRRRDSRYRPPDPPRPRPTPPPAPRVVDAAVGTTISEFARLLGVPPSRVETIVADLGETPASVEEPLEADVLELVAAELGRDVNVVGVSAHAETSADHPPRRAVVAVMGHVDHGKTTLLDALRSTSVAAGEAGGITQHLGAFVVRCSGGGELTFLDTPGHAAFSAMRKRGASVTDVAVLVCAADDGVMPQTREAAAHIMAANCKYVVALTKCDVEGADPARVREELIAMGVPLEQAGGDVQAVEVSAHTGMGMEDLEMALFLEAESMSLSAPRECDGSGTVLEARLDKGQGTVVTGLLRRGSLSVGDPVVAGTAHGRVRRLVGSGGVDVKTIGPSEPFELSGLRGVPGAGDAISRAATEERARRIATAREERAELARLGAMADAAGDRVFELVHTHAPVGERGKAAAKKTVAKSKLRASGVGAREGVESGLVDEEAEGDDGRETVDRDLCAIVKADVQGTAEAIRDSLLGLGTEAVGVKVVYLGVGGVTASDVSLAAAIGGPILAFNVRAPSNEVEKLARQSGVTIISRKVIYHLLDAVGDLIGGLAPERLVEEVLGEAEVRQVFDLSERRGNKANIVAGCLVNRGSLDGSEKFRLVRDGVVVHEGLLDCSSIRRHRLEVTTVGKGTDCGVSLADFQDVQPGDVLQCVHFVKRKAKVEKMESGGSRVVNEYHG